jgi:hypothetical protein
MKRGGLRPRMGARISKISLIVFVVLLVLSAFLLSVAGDYWPWYAVMSAFAVDHSLSGLVVTDWLVLSL